VTALRWQKAQRILRYVGMGIGIFLIAVESFDAIVTPRPDWFWFGAGLYLIWLCRPRTHVTNTPS
jgi:hypothetical protein